MRISDAMSVAAGEILFGNRTLLDHVHKRARNPIVRRYVRRVGGRMGWRSGALRQFRAEEALNEGVHPVVRSEVARAFEKCAEVVLDPRRLVGHLQVAGTKVGRFRLPQEFNFLVKRVLQAEIPENEFGNLTSEFTDGALYKPYIRCKQTGALTVFVDAIKLVRETDFG